MANVVKAWSFMAYCRDNFTSVKRAQFKDPEGKVFYTLMGKLKTPRKVVDETTGEAKTQEFESIHMSSKLDHPLTSEEVARDKDTLRIVQLEGSESLILCYPGEDTWEDVELGL